MAHPITNMQHVGLLSFLFLSASHSVTQLLRRAQSPLPPLQTSIFLAELPLAIPWLLSQLLHTN